MRFSVLPLLLAGASIVSLAAAEPIRVIESPSNENANIRLGHALANANVNGNDDNVARIVRPVVMTNLPAPDKNRGFGHHFCGASLREKALRLSNAFRHALGLPLIEAHVELPRPGHIHILPAGYPSHNVIVHSQEVDDEDGKPGKHHGHGRLDHSDGGDDQDHHRHRGPHRHHGHHGHRAHQHKHCKSFLKRIHRAIRSLGPWEGRAVAFVLGCGIGVLLRMFWVLSVLAYRTVRGEREETHDPEYIVYEQVPETIFIAPPEYVDEKASAEAHEKAEERK